MTDERLAPTVDLFNGGPGTFGVRCTVCGKSWLGRANYADLSAISKLVDAHLSVCSGSKAVRGSISSTLAVVHRLLAPCKVALTILRECHLSV